MRFVGSGIGHKATLQQRTPINVPEEVPDLQDEDIQHNCDMQDHTQAEEDHGNSDQ